MKLYAISDLHLHNQSNWQALLELPTHPDDWLIVAGDVSETAVRFGKSIALLAQKFDRVFWTPGNHDLWTVPQVPGALRGLAKYEQLVEICRHFGIYTPEDPFVRWPGPGPRLLIAPIFTFYDYSFRPGHVHEEMAVAWAEASGVLSTDEALLHTEPFPSAAVWCTLRCRYTEKRLEAVADQGSLLLATHFPLREDLLTLRRIPRFSIWCGTRRTEDWHTRFPVTAVVYGHLHVRGSYCRDGVRFEEVSLGYPRQWHHALGIQPYLREILPGR